MRLWKRASGALKDRSSLWQASLTRRTALRNPDIEKDVIRATSHHDSLDLRHVDRACHWLRLSPYNLKPILWSLSNRIEKTSSWIVTLKGLSLTHALINTHLSCVTKIGRLPYDLSNFKDAHLRQAKAWPFNAFVRAYYAFLDQKSTIIFQHAAEEDNKHDGFVMMRELVLLQKLQNLIDLLVQIKPASRAVFVPLILHVMEGLIIEVYDIYRRICRGIAIIFMNMQSAGKAEAFMALNIAQKASHQGEDLLNYFEFCQEIRVLTASEIPVIDRIPDEGIQELEQMIWKFSPDVEEEKAIILREENSSVNEEKNFRDLGTIITDKWEKFDEDIAMKNPFGSPVAMGNKIQEPPDLMTF